MSFKIQRFSASRWDMWARIDLPFVKDVALVTGTNGSGKTTILHGLQLALGNTPTTRAVNHYLKELGGPAVLLVVCTNPETAVKGNHLWQAVDRALSTPTVTVACRIELHNGDLRYRYRVLPGALSLEQADALLSTDAMGLREFRSALKHVVDSKTLKDLIIEQGDIASFSTKDGRSRFQLVQNRLLDRATIEQYQSAIGKLEEAKKDVFAKEKALREVELALEAKKRQARRRQEFNDLVTAETTARQQRNIAAWQHHADQVVTATSQAQRLEESIAVKGKLLDRLREELRQATASRDRIQAEIDGLRKEAAGHRTAARDAEHQYARLGLELEQLDQALAQLPGMTMRAQAIVAAEREAALKEQVAAETARRLEEHEADAIAKRIQAMESGRPVYPPEVDATLAQLNSKGIDVQILAESVKATSKTHPLLEGFLGPLRFAIHAESKDLATVIEAARSCNFPGPIHDGKMVTNAGHGLVAQNAVPAWLPQRLAEAKFDKDSWQTPEGIWVHRPTAVLAGQDHAEDLKKARLDHKAHLGQAKTHGESASKHGARVSDLFREEEQARLRDETKAKAQRRPSMKQAIEAAQKLAGAATATAGELEQRASAKEARLDPQLIAQHKLTIGNLEGEVGEHRKELLQKEAVRRDSQAVLDGLSADDSGLRTLAEGHKPVLLAKAEAAWISAQEALSGFERTGMPENDDIFAQVEVMARTFAGESQELDRRSRIRDEQQAETEKTRLVYLRQISSRLLRYKERLEKYGKYIEATIVVDLPTFTEKTTIEDIEAAKLEVGFGFDGKDPLPSGHPDFSGGQKVLQSLVQLMALDDAERAGFFIVDEPYHNLSVDRVEQVAKFLRNVGPQFIVTAPTGISKQMFGTATQFISVDKRPKGAKHASHPRIGSKEILLV